MDVAITIVMLVPVLLAVALIVGVIRKNITERQAGDPVDISGAIPAVIVLMVAVLIITAMGNAASPYTWDEDDGELTIHQNVKELSVQPWDSYASEVKSLVITGGVSIASGAFDSLTNLEYVKVADGVSIASGAFGVDFQNAMGSSVSDATGSDFVGFGDGTLYLCDPDVFTYTSGGRDVSGLASEYSSAKHLVIPAMHNGTAVTGIARDAFNGKTAIEDVLVHPEGETASLGVNVFSGCVSLARASFPTVTAIESNVFLGCAALESVYLPAATTIGSKVFSGCAALESVYLPAATTMSNNVFENCTALESVSLPEATAIGTSDFSGCTSLASASFPKATSLGLNSLSGCSSLAALEAPKLVTIGINALKGAAITEASFPSTTTLEANAFQNCASLESVSLPRITTIESGAFIGCAAIRSVSFGSSLTSVTSNAFQNWTFYESDGTTTIDKTVAANLAGKTFEGTAAALVEIAPDQSALTPEQLQFVHLHDAELQDLKDRINIDPLPFQPSFPTEEEEPVSA